MITLPSGNLLHDYWTWLKMAIEIADLPSYKMVIFHSYVSLPEAISHFQTHTHTSGDVQSDGVGERSRTPKNGIV